jgi:maltose alpha-D-glucosyltransferase/alpha-amylase
MREPATPDDLEAWKQDTQAQLDAGMAAMASVREGADEALAAAIDAALELRPAIEAAITGIDTVPAGLAKTRLHGDYHLGQVLVAKGDILILDFEGEPRRSLAERRAKGSPMRDVAGMLRSFDYAAWAAISRFVESEASAFDQLLEPAMAWRDLAQAAFLNGYREAIGDCPVWPADPAETERLLRLFIIQKLFYEVGYEAANRPAWLRIPLNGIRDLLGDNSEREAGGASAAG